MYMYNSTHQKISVIGIYIRTLYVHICILYTCTCIHMYVHARLHPKGVGVGVN